MQPSAAAIAAHGHTVALLASGPAQTHPRRVDQVLRLPRDLCVGTSHCSGFVSSAGAQLPVLITPQAHNSVAAVPGASSRGRDLPKDALGTWDLAHLHPGHQSSVTHFCEVSASAPEPPATDSGGRGWGLRLVCISWFPRLLPGGLGQKLHLQEPPRGQRHGLGTRSQARGAK